MDSRDTALPPDDEGLGNIRPEDATALPPDDDGLGNVRPEDAKN